jgi:hypothetical protein
MLAAVFFCSVPSVAPTAAAATPPPTPPPIGNPTTTPVPSPTPGTGGPSLATPSATLPPAKSAAKAHATPSPPANPRKGIEGVWEVQLQHPNTTDYTHFILKQSGDTLTGTYLDGSKKTYPLAGSVDGEAVRMIVSMPDGTSLLFEGKLDGTTDMLGMFTSPKEQLPFTASYRAKEKWIENVNPAPGGLGMPNSGGGQGGTYTPPL